LAVCVAMVAATGCSVELIPTPTPSARDCQAAFLRGTLAEGPAGSALVSWDVGEQPVQWPEGFVVENEPELRLLDERGNVVASEGEPIYVGGLFTAGDELFIACGYVGSDPP
jgi:hypothetical protein